MKLGHSHVMTTVYNTDEPREPAQVISQVVWWLGALNDQHRAKESTGISFGDDIYITLRINKIHSCTSKAATVCHLWTVYSAT